MLKPRLDIHFNWRQRACYLWGSPYTPNYGEFMLDHGRSAMVLALRSLKLPQGTGVGMMAYNCHTVMNAIEQANCNPVFIDVNEDLTIDVEDLKRKADGMSVLIVTHLFGIVNNVQRIKKEFPTLLIIEDCAHAYGIDHLYGDFVTFSFGQGKLPSLGNGGMLVVNNDRYYDEVQTIYNQLPSYSPARSFKLFTRIWMNSVLYRPWIYNLFTLPMKRRRSLVSGKEIIEPRIICRGVSAMYASEKGKIAGIIKKRINDAEKLAQEISKDIDRCYVGINAFMLVTWCDNPKMLQIKMSKRKIDTATHFSNAVDWAVEFGYHRGDCPKTEMLINHLLMIPTYE